MHEALAALELLFGNRFTIGTVVCAGVAFASDLLASALEIGTISDSISCHRHHGRIDYVEDTFSCRLFAGILQHFVD